MAKNKLTFNEQYHQTTVDEGRQRINEDGSVTTAKVMGINFEGKEYNLPSYNRFTQLDMSPEETLEAWLPMIKSGEITGYDTIEEAEEAQKKEHEIMDKYSRDLE